MVQQSTILLAFVAAVSAVPLNINLGAYSPALVVGDGEISLGAGGTAGASELMATLAQGAQQGAAGAAQQGQQQERGGEAQTAEVAQQGEKQPEGEQKQEQPTEGEAAKRGNLVRAVNDLLKREAAPEPVETAHLDAVAAATEWIKRDLNSFNAALTYARDAMKDQPKVELGTGAEGSGVGIIVNAGLNVPQNSAANGGQAGGERREKREETEEVETEEPETPKMTLVAITEV